MPYDEAEHRWKLHVLDESGEAKSGFIDPEELRQQRCPAWRSKPKGSYFEVMYRIAKDRFAILIRNGDPAKYEIVEADYFQWQSRRQVIQWFATNELELPAELRSANVLPPGGVMNKGFLDTLKIPDGHGGTKYQFPGLKGPLFGQKSERSKKKTANTVATADGLPADYFKTKYGIPAKRLEAARRSGRLPGKKRHGRWFYFLADVRGIWPDDFEELPPPNPAKSR